MAYCSVHGRYEDFTGHGCPQCQAVESQASSDRSDIIGGLESLERSQYSLLEALNNPGQYVCPHCRFRTLLLEASCCPKCQRSIHDSFWQPIRRALKQQRIRDEEDRRRRDRKSTRLNSSHLGISYAV